MPKELLTSRYLCLASWVAVRGRKMSKSCLGCWRVDADCLVNVFSGRCGCCIEKNLKCSLLVTQGDCQSPFSLSCNVLNKSFLRDCIDRQKLFLQAELDKACVENAKLRAKELLLIEKCSCLNKKRWTFLLRELQLRKQLGVLSEREKELFSQELASIEELEKAEQEASQGVVKTESITDSFSGFNFSPSILTSFNVLANIPQFFQPSQG